MKRVMCLYRVSTKGQVAPEDDIPMQRRECMDFILQHKDWKYVGELMEKGVSGYKVSASKRDAIVQMRTMAERKEFDVLLVFMFDRLGRREDETPFLVQWFIEHGIEVWSTREGQQRLDNRADKLINYIRFWQAGGESEKISLRVSAAHSQMTADGKWRGGVCPFGYKLVHKGRIGKKNRPLYDLEIDETAGAIVREIFELYVKAGYGALRICNHLNDKYPNPNKVWTRPTIMTILRNPIYTGRMHMNDIRSKPIEELRLVSDSDFDAVQEAIKARIPRQYNTQNRTDISSDGTTKTAMYGASLLSGLLYCKHCGCRLVGTFCSQSRNKGPYIRPIYRCYNGAVAAKGCDGLTVYSAKRIENAVEEAISGFFSQIQSEIHAVWTSKDHKQIRTFSEGKLDIAEKNLSRLESQRKALEHETVESIMGNSRYDFEVLTKLINDNKVALGEAKREVDRLKALDDSNTNVSSSYELEYQQVLNWRDIFDNATVSEKKTILCQLIDRIEVDRNYQITIFLKGTKNDFLVA